jgi:hypothetical protein
MALIKIRRSPDGTAVTFEPDPITLNKNGDFVVWANHDREAAHQPTLASEGADYWMDDPLPPFEEGQPAATSPAINFSGTAAISYEDGLEEQPRKLSGTMQFV